MSYVSADDLPVEVGLINAIARSKQNCRDGLRQACMIHPKFCRREPAYIKQLGDNYGLRLSAANSTPQSYRAACEQQLVQSGSTILGSIKAVPTAKVYMTATRSNDNGVIRDFVPPALGRNNAIALLPPPFDVRDEHVQPDTAYLVTYKSVPTSVNSISNPFTFFIPSLEKRFQYGPLVFRDDVPHTFFRGHVTGVLFVKRDTDWDTEPATGGEYWPPKHMVFIVTTHSDTRDEIILRLGCYPGPGCIGDVRGELSVARDLLAGRAPNGRVIPVGERIVDIRAA